MWAAVRVTPCGYCPLTVCCFSPVLQSVVRMVALPSTGGPCPSDRVTRPTSYHLQALPAPSLSCGELFAVIKFIMLLSFNSHTCQGGTAPLAFLLPSRVSELSTPTPFPHSHPSPPPRTSHLGSSLLRLGLHSRPLHSRHPMGCPRPLGTQTCNRGLLSCLLRGGAWFSFISVLQ